MAFIGNTNTTQAFTPAVDFFSGNASTTAFTLSRPVASVAQVQAVISNVPQDPGSAYTVSGNTITFTSAPPSGTNNIYVSYTSPITQVIAPSQGTVGTTQIQNGVTVNFADGSAAAPSITNDGDSNTGMFFPAADTIAFATAGTEDMRIDSTGDVIIGGTTVTANARFNVYQADSSQRVVHFENTRNVSGDENLRLVLGTNCNNTSSYPLILTTGGAQKLEMYGNGNIANVNNSYGALSDIKLKENIVDATPKLADLMRVKIRNYNLIGDTTKQIGVVAQELETVFPAMIDESPDRDGESGNLSTVTKSVKYSVFVPMLIKAIQEQQALITTLTARITALESA
jgi:hypothetical protein